MLTPYFTANLTGSKADFKDVFYEVTQAMKHVMAHLMRQNKPFGHSGTPQRAFPIVSGKP